MENTCSRDKVEFIILWVGRPVVWQRIEIILARLADDRLDTFLCRKKVLLTGICEIIPKYFLAIRPALTLECLSGAFGSLTPRRCGRLGVCVVQSPKYRASLILVVGRFREGRDSSEIVILFWAPSLIIGSGGCISLTDVDKGKVVTGGAWMEVWWDE
jgi:hypothetical protein